MYAFKFQRACVRARARSQCNMMNHKTARRSISLFRCQRGIARTRRDVNGDYDICQDKRNLVAIFSNYVYLQLISSGCVLSDTTAHKRLELFQQHLRFSHCRACSSSYSKLKIGHRVSKSVIVRDLDPDSSLVTRLY